MNRSDNNQFATFIRTCCANLLTDLANSLAIQVEVLDAANNRVFVTEHNRGIDSDKLASDQEKHWAPIYSTDEVLGSLIAFANDGSVGPLLVSLANHFGDQFCIEQDLGRLTEQLAQCYDEINLLYRFSRAVQPDEGFEKTAHRILDESIDFLDNRWASLYLPELDCKISSVGIDFSPNEEVLQITRDSESLNSIFSSLNRALADQSNPVKRHAGHIKKANRRIHYVVSPIMIRRTIAGFAGLFHADDDDFFETGELRLLECLSEEISNAATTRELYNDLKDTLFSTVKGLVAAIDAKDEYTRGHSERVYQYSILLGQRMGFSEKEMQSLTWSAMLHDVGKIAISRSILNKPGRLTDEEFDIIKTHPDKGCKVLEPIPQLKHVLPNIRHHHERFDGLGYPCGLVGEEIPLVARIIAVADTFDAICSSRAYRTAQTLEFAIGQIRHGAGTQFDPKIAHLMLDLIAENETDGIAGTHYDKNDAAA